MKERALHEVRGASKICGEFLNFLRTFLKPPNYYLRAIKARDDDDRRESITIHGARASNIPFVAAALGDIIIENRIDPLENIQVVVCYMNMPKTRTKEMTSGGECVELMRCTPFG
jgi:hypothetical protein